MSLDKVMVVLCKVVLTLILNSMMNSLSVAIHIKAFEQCFPVVPCFKRWFYFEFVDEILKCDHSTESF